MFNNVVKGDDLEKKINIVLDDMAEHVGRTFGPNGLSVAYRDRETGFPRSTKDGLTVLRNLSYMDELMDVIHTYMKEAAITQEKEVGDGTTTMTLVTVELYKRLSKYIKDNGIQNSVAMKIFEKVKNVLTAYIEGNARPITDLSDIRILAYTSTDGDAHLSQIIHQIYSQHQNAKININFSSANKHSYTAVDGCVIDCQLLFKNKIFKDYHIARIDTKLSVVLMKGVFAPSYSEFTDLVHELRTEDKNLIIICNDIGDDVSRFMNAEASEKLGLTKNVFFACVSEVQDEYFAETGSLFNAKTIIQQDLTNMSKSDEGFVANLLNISTEIDAGILGSNGITLVGTKRNEEAVSAITKELDAKIEDIIAQSGDTPETRPMINSLLSKKIKLSRIVVNLYVGGETNQMTRYNMGLADDAVRSIENALEHGILDGMNKTILQLTSESIGGHEDKLSEMETYMYEMIDIVRDSYVTVTKKLEVTPTEDFIDNITKGKVLNLRLGDETIPVINNAYTDLVILKNAYDNVILFMMSAFLKSRPDVAMIKEG